MQKQITLSEYFEESGIRKDKFAKLIGVSPNMISLYLSGECTPKLSVLRKIYAYSHGLVGFESKWGDELKETV